MRTPMSYAPRLNYAEEHPNPWRKAFEGLRHAEVRVLVSVVSCIRAEGGYPTREAMRAIHKAAESGIVTHLCSAGWLEKLRPGAGLVVYRATEKTWRLLGGYGLANVAAE